MDKKTISYRKVLHDVKNPHKDNRKKYGAGGAPDFKKDEVIRVQTTTREVDGINVSSHEIERIRYGGIWGHTKLPPLHTWTEEVIPTDLEWYQFERNRNPGFHLENLLRYGFVTKASILNVEKMHDAETARQKESEHTETGET